MPSRLDTHKRYAQHLVFALQLGKFFAGTMKKRTIKGVFNGLAQELFPNHFDQTNRDNGTLKFRRNLRTLRANVDVSSLETDRSPALMRLSEPGVAPLSRGLPQAR